MFKISGAIVFFFFPFPKREIGVFAYWKKTPFAGFNKIQIKKAKEKETKKGAPVAPQKADVH